MSIGDQLFTFEKEKLPPIVVLTTIILIAILVLGAALRVLLYLAF
ncbi:hypothetical protein ACLI4U_08230 [Natrialbaceae archaeon A-CW2]|uniref:Uncharacterized protein n=1 Tax=Natronosalvus hydrolyticus TaxID=2979988 RepID=A0AAP2Z7M6_9EURY|nr:hypothetical protein [Natronosalvus amylolyticus]MCU4751788.1 hypothetical protein [Halobacteria archaeon AArc-curdl1]